MTLFDPYNQPHDEIDRVSIITFLCTSHSCSLYYFFKMRKRKFRDDISLDRSHLDTKARTRALSGTTFCCSGTKSCLTLCDPMDCSMPGFSVLHYLQSLHSCSLSRRCHPIISSSVDPFFSHLQSFPASESFPMSQLFISGDQSTGASASALVLTTNIQS